MHDNRQKSGWSWKSAYCLFRPRKRNVREDQINKVSFLKKDCFTLEIQTTNEQKGFHHAEWLLRPGTRVFAGGFSSTPLYATNIAYNYILWSATMMVIDNGVARGNGPSQVSPFWGDTICCFFLLLRPKTFTYFRSEIPTSFCCEDLFFLVFTYILANKGCHHEIPPRVPPFLATPLIIDTVGSFYIFFFATEDPAAILYSLQIDQKCI